MSYGKRPRRFRIRYLGFYKGTVASWDFQSRGLGLRGFVG